MLVVHLYVFFGKEHSAPLPTHLKQGAPFYLILTIQLNQKLEAFLILSSRWCYSTNFWFLLPEPPQVEASTFHSPLLPSEAWLHVVLITACL